MKGRKILASLQSYLVCVCSDRNPKSPGQSKVGQLDDSLHIDEEVLGLQVSVQYPMGMAELDAFQHLICVALWVEQEGRWREGEREDQEMGLGMMGGGESEKIFSKLQAEEMTCATET